MIDIYLSALRHGDDAGAFFEADDDSAFFYLMDMNEFDGRKIRKAIPILNLPENLDDNEIYLRISDDQEAVALFIGGKLVAAFEFLIGSSFALNAGDEGQVAMPDWVARHFRVH